MDPCSVQEIVVDVVFAVVVVAAVVVVSLVVVGGWVVHGPGYSNTPPSSHQSIHGTGPVPLAYNS